MAATITAFTVSLGSLTDTEIATLKAAMPPNGLFATYVQNSGQGNLEDLTESSFNGTVTFRPAAANNAENTGALMDVIQSVVAAPLMGWVQE